MDLEKIKVSYRLDINYKKLFGKNWAKKLNKLINSNYFYNLMVFLNEAYKVMMLDGHNVKTFMRPPKPEFLFENFRLSPYYKTKVVLMVDGMETSNRVGGSGINVISKTYGTFTSLWKLKHSVETRFHNGLNLNFDETLVEWMEQGVFILPEYQTCLNGNRLVHQKIWKEFNREVIKALNQKYYIIFVFFGERLAKEYGHLLDDSTHDIIVGDPLFADKDKHGLIPWTSESLELVNDILKERKQTIINW